MIKSKNMKSKSVIFRLFKKDRKSSDQRKRYTRSKVGNFFYVLFLIAFGLFSVLPLVYCICTSFKPIDELLIFPPRFFVNRPTFENYAALPSLLSNMRVPLSKYIFNSVFITGVTTALYVFISTAAGFVLSKTKMRINNILITGVQVALLFNGFTLAIPQYLIFSYTGMVDTYWIYILPYCASSMGVFLMKQYIDGSVPEALLEAARIDGAGQLRIFSQIVVPMVKPCMMTLTLFGFQAVWSTVPDGTIFSETLKTLPTIMANINSGGIARSGSAMAVTVIMMIPPIAIYLITQSNVLESMNSAGIKE